MKIRNMLRATSCAAAGLLVALSAMPASAAPVITTVNADLSAQPFTINFRGSSFTITGTGSFPNYIGVTTTGTAAVRTVFGNPSTDFINRGTVVYDQNTLGGYGSFTTPTTIGATNGDNFLGLRVTSGGQNYYGFLYSTNTTLNSYGFESTAETGITATSAAVPEPASWAMMIAGFGLVGGAMRSRRRATLRFA